MDRIEQFWYTSAPATAARSAGFQVVAASPGLGGLADKALRLCRYDPPTDLGPAAPAPVSFGWVDSEGLRLCFHRVPAGLDGYGRPGNLAAHILIGPPELLPAAAVAACFGSSWWWTGSIPPDQRLPSLASLRMIPRGKVTVPDGLLAPFIDALLARTTRSLVSVRADPGSLAALAVAAEQAAPGIMDAHSLSTYEGPQTAPWFDVVGTSSPINAAIVVTAKTNPHIPPTVARARTLLLTPHPSPRDKRVTELALKTAGLGSPRPDIPSLAGILAAYSELDAGRVPDAALFIRLLNGAVADRTLAEYAEARDETARALIQQRSDVTAALTAALASGMSRTASSQIGAAAGRLLVRGALAPESWSDSVAVLSVIDSGLSVACQNAIIDASGESPELLERIPVGLRMSLLRLAAERPLAAADPAVLRMLDSLGKSWPAVADNPRFPPSYRARALAGASRSGTSAAAVAQVLLKEPGIAGEFAAANPVPRLLFATLQRAQPDRREDLALKMTPALQERPRDELLKLTAADIPSAERRLRFLLAARDLGVLPHTGPSWSELVRSSLAEALRLRLGAGDIPPVTKPQHDLLHWCGDDPCASWLKVLRACQQRRLDVQSFGTAVTAAATLSSRAERDAALLLTTVYFASQQTLASQFARAIASFGDQGFDIVWLMVSACLIVMRSSGNEIPGRELMRCLIKMAELNKIDLSGKQRSAAAAQSEILARSLSGPYREELDEIAREAGSEVAIWWYRLTGHQPTGWMRRGLNLARRLGQQ